MTNKNKLSCKHPWQSGIIFFGQNRGCYTRQTVHIFPPLMLQQKFCLEYREALVLIRKSRTEICEAVIRCHSILIASRLRGAHPGSDARLE